MEILEARRYLIFVVMSVATNEFTDAEEDIGTELMYENVLAHAAREYIQAIDTGITAS